MKCPSCHFENPEGMKFCGRCGAKLERICPKCNFSNPSDFVFCGECGQDLERKEEIELTPEGERKHVAVLFSDLSGYTAMSERLDPEEVKEVKSRIFGEIAQVVARYEGFIEKFIGDAVVALFGAPKAHEDDSVRAILAAREIHELVAAMSPQLEGHIGQPLSMHSGVNTGLVVTGALDLQKGTYEVTGDAINVASRLCSLAKAGEIMVGQETYRQAEGHFTFEVLEPTKVKGKGEPVQIYKVLAPKEEPSKIHRLSGMKADLIGRKVEMAQLSEAVQRLQEGKGTIISICGDAGTGKSRLVEEFRATLDLEEIQWREGNAYAYSQNIPYFPLIDLLNQAWQIEEGDPPERVKEKVESGIERLIARSEEVVPYIGGLYALSYPQIEGVSPEFWKSRLQEAIQTILAALSRRAPTVICLEDLHWADPSTLDLLRFILSEFRYPALFLCVYRPPFSLFTSHQMTNLGQFYQEIKLQDLSPSETQDMVDSLLKTKTIPTELKRFIQEKVEGNPFYLEEVINSLIEVGTLARDNGNWGLTRPIGDSDIPSTVQGVISARLDRLDREMKRILQEASVIGRVFLYEILKKITELQGNIDRCLNGLERLDLIRTRSFQPELEYFFKHALTQEVVYNGLLKKERQRIHERIALVMEQLFHDRIAEFYETLAFHFAQGESLHQAVNYLMKSGEKSLKRYAVEESHQYYQDAFDLLISRPDKSKEEEGLFIDLLIEWAFVFYYRGDFKGLTDLFIAHEDLAESLDDKARLGMFYAWLGFALVLRGRGKDSYKYLCRALELGEATGNRQVIGYACTWLAWTCIGLGHPDEAVMFGERAKEISRFLESDHYLYFKPLAGIGYASFGMGNRKRAMEAGEVILKFGLGHSNTRSMVLGHNCIGWGHMIAGDFRSATKCFQRAIQISSDPFYSEFTRLHLGLCLLFEGQVKEAEDSLTVVLNRSQELGYEGVIGMMAYAGLGVVCMTKGQLSRGLKMLEKTIHHFRENDFLLLSVMFEHTLGKVYLQMVQGAGPRSIFSLARNIGFMVKNLPLASKKAEDHLNKAIVTAKEIGAKGVLAQAYLDLGLLHRAKKRAESARECLSEAIQIFEQSEAEMYLKQAKEALESL